MPKNNTKTATISFKIIFVLFCCYFIIYKYLKYALIITFKKKFTKKFKFPHVFVTCKMNDKGTEIKRDAIKSICSQGFKQIFTFIFAEDPEI